MTVKTKAGLNSRTLSSLFNHLHCLLQFSFCYFLCIVSEIVQFLPEFGETLLRFFKIKPGA